MEPLQCSPPPASSDERHLGGQERPFWVVGGLRCWCLRRWTGLGLSLASTAFLDGLSAPLHPCRLSPQRYGWPVGRTSEATQGPLSSVGRVPFVPREHTALQSAFSGTFQVFQQQSSFYHHPSRSAGSLISQACTSGEFLHLC